MTLVWKAGREDEALNSKEGGVTHVTQESGLAGPFRGGQDVRDVAHVQTQSRSHLVFFLDHCSFKASLSEAGVRVKLFLLHDGRPGPSREGHACSRLLRACAGQRFNEPLHLIRPF